MAGWGHAHLSRTGAGRAVVGPGPGWFVPVETSDCWPGALGASLFTARAQNAHLDALERGQSEQARGYAAQISSVLDWYDLLVLDQGTCPDLAATELAPVLRVGQRRAVGLLHDALRLRTHLPVLLRALADGILWCPQAAVLLAETAGSSAAVCARVSQALLDPDGTASTRQLSPADLRRRVLRAIATAEADLEPQAAQDRERDARAQRDVRMSPGRDGTAHLWALLTVEQALGHARDLDALYKKVALDDQQAGIARTAGQRRADVLAMLPTIALRAWDHPLTAAQPGEADGDGRDVRPASEPRPNERAPAGRAAGVVRSGPAASRSAGPTRASR